MNQHEFSSTAHRDCCNPLSVAKIERILDLLPLGSTSRVLDLGCGCDTLGFAVYLFCRPGMRFG